MQSQQLLSSVFSWLVFQNSCNEVRFVFELVYQILVWGLPLPQSFINRMLTLSLFDRSMFIVEEVESIYWVQRTREKTSNSVHHLQNKSLQSNRKYCSSKSWSSFWSHKEYHFTEMHWVKMCFLNLMCPARSHDTICSSSSAFFVNNLFVKASHMRAALWCPPILVKCLWLRYYWLQSIACVS